MILDLSAREVYFILWLLDISDWMTSYVRGYRNLASSNSIIAEVNWYSTFLDRSVMSLSHRSYFSERSSTTSSGTWDCDSTRCICVNRTYSNAPIRQRSTLEKHLHVNLSWFILRNSTLNWKLWFYNNSNDKIVVCIFCDNSCLRLRRIT